MSVLPPSDARMRRLLVIRSGAVGDFIVTLPVLGALRQTFPQARIDVLGHPRRALLACHARYANRLVDLDSGGW
jgi:heptosyltransferase-2